MFPEAYLILAQTVFGELGDDIDYFFSGLWRALWTGLKWMFYGWSCFVVVGGVGVSVWAVWLLRKEKAKPPVLK